MFYVVAKVGPGESSRPIAVSLWQGGLSPNEAVDGLRVPQACLQVVDILSTVGNRTAIQGELSLAADFYKNDSDGLLIPRTELPELNRWLDNPSLAAKRSRSWHRHFTEFPFISTCLLVGVGYDQTNGCKNSPRTELLGTVYRDDSIEYGMVVIDISDLDEIRYGIVGFMVRQMVETPDDLDPDDDSYEAVPIVEEPRSRKPLSANEYMSRFHPNRFGDPYAFGDVVNRLEEKPLVTVSAMDFIWPSNAGIAATTNQIHEGSSTSAVHDHDIRQQIDNFLCTNIYDASLLDNLHALPNLQDILRCHLHTRSEEPNTSSHASAFGQLLAIAFSKQQHLDWVLLKGLTTDALAAAIQTKELEDAKSISLSIDSIHGTTIQLLDALSLSQNIREIYLLQGPTRVTDTQSTDIFLALSSSNHLSLLKCKLFFTGAYSAGLRKTFWLPPATYKPNIQAFPIQHMFVRHQIGSSPQFWPNHFYLGDAMLHPQRFTAGFLQYMQSLITGESMVAENLYSFACAPSTFAENASSTEISPIPAETNTIPTWALTRDEKLRMHAECWPEVRDLISGSWVVVVSKEKYIDRDAVQSKAWPRKPSRAIYLKYALVRLKTQLVVDQAAETLTPEIVQVGGIKEFLQIVAPEVNPDRVEQRLQELQIYISHSPDQAALGPGMSWLSVFEPQEACSILRDFLEDAKFVKGNLKMAMEDNQTERDWYPELFRDQTSQGARYIRNAEIFRSCYI